MRALTSLLIFAFCHAPVVHALAIPMDDEAWLPDETPAHAAPKPKAKPSRIETVQQPPKQKKSTEPASKPAAAAKSTKPTVKKLNPQSVAKSEVPTPAPQAKASPVKTSASPSVAKTEAPATPAANPPPVKRSAALQTPPPAAKPKPETPKVAEKPAAPKEDKPKVTCSGRTSEIKDLNARSIDTNVFNLTWAEDTPVVGGSARFKVSDNNGDAQIEMINSSGESVGVSPAKMCLITLPSGKKALRVSLQMAKLNLGFLAGAKIRGMLMQKFGTADELPIIVSASDQKGKIHISDGVDKSMINSNFTNVSAHQ